MKKLNLNGKPAVVSVFLLMAIGLSGCFLLRPNYHVYDEFTNAHRYTLTVSEPNKERGSDIGWGDIKCSRIVTATNDSVSFYISVGREFTSRTVNEKGFMRANGKQFEIRLNDIADNDRSSNKTTITKDTTTTGKQTKTISTNNQVWKVTTFVVHVTPDMLAAIRSGKDLTLRFYFGPDLATYKVPKSSSLFYRILDEDPLKK